jgi:hypothetical protein
VGFAGAVDYLLGQTNLPAAERKPYEPPKKELVLPYRSKENRAAFAYLTKTRGIDPDITGEMMKRDRIYQGRYFNKEAGRYETVCAFLGYDGEGKARYCAMRGVSPGSGVKRDKTGSDKRFAFCMEGRSSRLYVLEAPIEALAHATLTKLDGGDWTLDHRLTLGGMSAMPLDRYLEKHPGIDTVIFALNNDYGAVDKDGQPDNRGQKRAAKLAAACRERGYAVKNQVPVNVDFDDDLICYRRHGSVFREHGTAAQAPVPAPVPKPAPEETEGAPEWDEDEWLP